MLYLQVTDLTRPETRRMQSHYQPYIRSTRHHSSQSHQSTSWPSEDIEWSNLMTFSESAHFYIPSSNSKCSFFRFICGPFYDNGQWSMGHHKIWLDSMQYSQKVIVNCLRCSGSQSLKIAWDDAPASPTWCHPHSGFNRCFSGEYHPLKVFVNVHKSNLEARTARDDSLFNS
jgi:hypothetical protein